LVTKPDTGQTDPAVTKAEVEARIEALRQDVVRQGRTLLTGDPNGRARRNLLFVVTAGLIIVAPPLALLPLLLLALTDMVTVD